MTTPSTSTHGKVNVSSLTHVPETMLIPLYFKAKETRETGLIKDEKAVEIVNQIDYDFAKFDKDDKTQIGVVTRTYLFDKILQDLITQTNGNLVVVNLGAGLDTRQERFPQVKWYQLDLPESIAIRKQFFKEGSATLIPKSLLDFSWMDDIEEKENVLFIAEGLFMYFKEEDVKAVFEHIADHFTHAWMAFNPIPKTMVGAAHNSVDTTQAPMLWGIWSLQEVLNWNTGWRELTSYYPPDYFKDRWHWMHALNLPDAARKAFVIGVMEVG